MNKYLPLRMTVLAALMAGLSAQAADVVISQVYGGGGNSGATYKNDFIEIFNRSAAPVTLTGWSVQYASATGTTWGVTTIPTVTLQPGQYYLVAEAAGSGGTTDIGADRLGGTLALSGTQGKVALSSATVALSGANPSGGALVDLVGWGTVNGFEGAPAGGTSNPTSVQRGHGGCDDTDNNSADFAVAAAAPRNTGTAFNACGVAPAKPIIASCPAALGVVGGSAGSVLLAASDEDGVVNGATITAGAVPGISLSGFSAAAEAGGSASVTLNAAGTLANGSYPVTVKFTNDQSQSATCTVSVNVAGLAAVTHTIPEIQGAGATSPYNNTVQTTEGVITAKVGTGFFMQDAVGDGNPDTSDGIFVYMGATNTTANVGDQVRVTATVTEYTPSGAARSYTEMKDASAIATMATGMSITPTNIEMPNAQLAKVEGMLVRFTTPLTVNQSEFLGPRGELSLAYGRREVPTNRYPARSPEAVALAADNANNLITLDDGIFTTPNPVPYIGVDSTVRVGDTISDLTGVIDFGALGGGGAGFKLQPTVAPVFSRDNSRTPPPELAAGNVKVASANVLNFFTTFTNGTNAWGASGVGCTIGGSTSKSNCRGADNMAEFVRQRDKIVAELRAIDADVFGLMEIENNGDTTVDYLVNALNATYDHAEYAVVPKPAATGTDAIRVAMIYKPARLALVGSSLSDAASINNRPPMAQTFKAGNGEKFSLVVNHLKSKGSCPSGTGLDADQKDSQGCWNATRIKQAQQLVNVFVPQVQSAAGDPDVLLIGDFNSYGMEDPIAAITATGFTNQLERFVRPVGIPHSFVFDAASGYLDHALASPALHAQVVGAAEWNVNADEPTFIDYNTDGKQQDLYNALPYRASDHDPVVISLDLQLPYKDVTASLKTYASGLVFNRASGKFTGTLQLTNKTDAALAGPLQVELQGLPAGVTLANATGMHNGAPYITLPVGMDPAAVVTVPLQFNNPSKTLFSYTLKVFSGSF